ncbi:MAG: hypothetical protein B7Y41_14225 [Hydrogenophilales bacterium 28-61-23]|nr:MAG: hypothetical protein B7Y41_14225 [Hydrogenophilales bacterium 28-61-23]
MTLQYSLQRYSQALSLGTIPYLVYLAQGLRKKYFKPDHPYSLISKDARFPLKCRPDTSDLGVFDQIFIKREYECLDDVVDPGLIIDCGGNVGYSSAYFLTRFRQARLIAVEPDPDNFKILKENLNPYGDRFEALCSGIWSHPAGLVLSEEEFGDGREWARTVREARDGEEAAMTAVDIGSLLDNSGFDRISILKIDIEGAETVVFGSNFELWINRVDNLVIELHSDECRSVFMNAIDGLGFKLTHSGELTVCKRLA